MTIGLFVQVPRHGTTDLFIENDYGSIYNTYLHKSRDTGLQTYL